MSESDFKHLVQKIVPNIEKQDTVMKKSIAINTSLTISLRILVM